MNSIQKDIVLGFYDEVSTPTIYAKFLDTERKLHCQLINEMSAYIVEDITYIYIKERYSDGTIMAPHLVTDYELSEDHTELTIPLTKNMLAVTGLAKCEIVFIRANSVPQWDDEGHLISDDSEVLSTHPFNIYIDPSVYDGGCLSSADNFALSELLPLVISAQMVVDHDEEYTRHEEQRMANENVRIANENEREGHETDRRSAEEQRIIKEDERLAAEEIRITNEDDRINAEEDRELNEIDRKESEIDRKDSESQRKIDETERLRAEQERVAREGKDGVESYDYIDSDGNEHTVKYYDSRVAVAERTKALNEGGTYIDEYGDRIRIKNTYTDRHGQEVPVDVSDLNYTSYMALAGYMKKLSEDNYFTTLSESYAHGGTGIEDRPNEDTDNSMYYCNRSAENKAETEQLRDETRAIRDSIDDALEENIPNFTLDLATGHLMWTGGRFDFLVDEDDGHLYWDIA